MHGGSGGAMGCDWQREWHDVQAVCRHLGGMQVEMIDLFATIGCMFLSQLWANGQMEQRPILMLNAISLLSLVPLWTVSSQSRLYLRHGLLQVTMHELPLALSTHKYIQSCEELQIP